MEALKDKKIVIENVKYEVISLYDKPNCLMAVETAKGKRRNTVAIRLNMPYSQAKTICKDNMNWGIEETYTTTDSEGNPREKVIYNDWSNYNLICYLIDNMDGTCTYVAGQTTDSELQAQMINDILGV